MVFVDDIAAYRRTHTAQVRWLGLRIGGRLALFYILIK